MKILDFMSFNVDWFLTKQGLLITGGVLLLLIALIILVTSGKKEDDSDPTEAIANAAVPNDLGFNQVNPAPAVQPQVVTPEVPTLDPMTTVAPVSQPEVLQTANLGMGIAAAVPVTPVSQPQPVQPTNVGIVDVTPTVQVTPENNFGVINSVPPFEPQPVVQPAVEFNPTPVQPQIDPIASVAPVVPSISEFNVPDPMGIANANMGIDSIATPVVEQPVVSVPEIPQQPAVSIYGGVNPTQDIFGAPEAVKPVIYGGADPLENTGAIPKVSVAPAMEQPAPAVNMFEPVMPSVAPTPVASEQTFPGVAPVTQVGMSQPANKEVEELVF